MILLFTRLFNLVKILSGYLISRITKKVIHWGNPVAVSIEPNNTCNLHCPECPAGMKELSRARGVMQPALFRSIIDQLQPQLSYLTLYFQGEPYMSTHFFDFIAYARKKMIFVVSSTNGHFLDEISVQRTIESGLNRLIISLDGADTQSYETYRQGGDFDKVISGIRLLVSEKKRQHKRTPEIVLQCLVLKTNENQLDEVRMLARELGVDKLEFKTAQFNDYENGNPLMPENQRYSRYRKVKEVKMQNAICKVQSAKVPAPSPVHPFTGSPVYRFTPKNRMPDSCFRMSSSCVITWDGKVVPCCFDKDATHAMGDLAKQSFREIWRGKSYHKFRMKVLSSRKSIDICRNCSQTF
jgi:radical SAM protein with 4Fe4S-binding SPASM domain